MIIRNGFVKTMVGDWLNMSKVFAFTCEQRDCECENGAHLLVAIIDPDNVRCKVEICEYESKEDALNMLDFMMKHSGKHND